MSSNIYIFVFIAVLVVLLLVHHFSARERTRRALKSVARVSIGSMPTGVPTRIVGRIVDGETIVAPISGRACVFFEIIVEERRNDRWRTVIEDKQGVPFVVQDDTGHAKVDPTAARVALVSDSHSRSGTFDDPTEEEAAFLARHGEKGTGLLFNRKLRYREGILEPGETVAVAGIGSQDSGSGSGEATAKAKGYRDWSGGLVRIDGSAEFQLAISDMPDTTEA